MRSRWSYCFLVVLLCACSLAVQGQDKPANVSGKWQLSWEARLGTARGELQLQQTESKLNGSFQGPLGAPRVSGTMEGKNVTLTLDFQGPRPFSLVFKGLIDGDKMAGKFSVKGVEEGYDSHGENARPSTYSWTAVRRGDEARSQVMRQNQPDPKN